MRKPRFHILSAISFAVCISIYTIPPNGLFSRWLVIRQPGFSYSAFETGCIYTLSIGKGGTSVTPYGYQVLPGNQWSCLRLEYWKTVKGPNTGFYLWIPLYPFFLMSAILPVWWFIRFPGCWFVRNFQLRRPFPAGCCHRCGYNLTGNVSGICPECGTPVPPKADAVTKD